MCFHIKLHINTFSYFGLILIYCLCSRYVEINNYDYGTATTKNGEAVGHFTQMVWRDTTKFGVGIATRENGDGNIDTFIVARYAPRGNIHTTGQRFEDYSRNVQPPIPGCKTYTYTQLHTLLYCLKVVSFIPTIHRQLPLLFISI